MPEISTPMTDALLDDMEAKARAATQLEWRTTGIRPHTVEDGTVTVQVDKPFVKYAIRVEWRDEFDRRCTRFLADVHPTFGHEGVMQANAAHLVASQPANVIALIERLRAAELAVAAARHLLTEDDHRA